VNVYHTVNHNYDSLSQEYNIVRKIRL